MYCFFVFVCWFVYLFTCIVKRWVYERIEPFDEGIRHVIAKVGIWRRHHLEKKIILVNFNYGGNSCFSWFKFHFFGKYSGGSNSEHLNTEYIRNPNILMFWFGMVRFSNGRFFSYSYGTDHSKTELFKMAALA